MAAGQESNAPITFFRSSAEFGECLEQRRDQTQEIWVGFHKKSSTKTGITYQEALDEALCFGWIDGVRKNIDETSYTIRFSPRKARSIWSAVNIQRVQGLTKLGLMRPPGLVAFERRDENRARQYSHEQRIVELDPVCQEKFRTSKQAWEFFQSQPKGYQRTMKWWVMSAKKEETRLRRLAALIEESEKGLRLAPFGGPSKRMTSRKP